MKQFIKLEDKFIVDDLQKMGIRHKFTEGDGIYVYEKSDRLISTLADLQSGKRNGKEKKGKYSRRRDYFEDDKLRF